VTEFLLDVNVLVALAWPTHIHHRAAMEWFRELSDDRWASCPMTQCGFVRISSNPRITPDAVSPGQAWSVLREMISHRRHVFWCDDLDVKSDIFSEMQISGHRQVMDAYLFALAIKRNSILATFDVSLKYLVSDGSSLRSHIACIPLQES
jgi:hypothetical protein